MTALLVAPEEIAFDEFLVRYGSAGRAPRPRGVAVAGATPAHQPCHARVGAGVSTSATWRGTLTTRVRALAQSEPGAADVAHFQDIARIRINVNIVPVSRRLP